MTNPTRGFIYDRSLLALLILIALVMRCWDLFALPYMHDELSALSRTRFESLGHLFEKGILPDAHPPLVQLFLYGWTGLFGFTPWVVKLPFILASVLAVPMTWWIGRQWFGSATGLVSSAFMAVLQFPVMHGQLARPYAFGLLFTLLLVIFWMRIVDRGAVGHWTAIGYILSAALCAYTHYFSMLMAFVVGVSGLFFLRGRALNRYMVWNGVAVLLFVPYLPAFYQQMMIGDLNWMDPPGVDFLLRHLSYGFAHSPWVMGFVIVLAGLSVFRTGRGQRNDQDLSRRSLALIWWAIPLLVGWIYSRVVGPVLQHKVLLFGFPFLLLGLFSFGELLPKVRTGMTLLALLIGIDGTVRVRRHYDLFYEQPFERIVENAAEAKQKYGKNLAIVINKRPRYIALQSQVKDVAFQYENIFRRDLTPLDLRKMLMRKDKEQVLIAGMDPKMVRICRDLYPFIVKRAQGFTHDIFLLSRDAREKNFSWDERCLNLEGPQGELVEAGTKGDEGKKEKGLSGSVPRPENERTIEAGKEWGPGSDLGGGGDWLPGVHRVVGGDCFVYVPEEGVVPGGVLVLELWKNGEKVLWRGGAVRQQVPDKPGWHPVHVAFRLSTWVKEKATLDDLTVKIHFWNKEKERVRLRDIRLCSRAGNKWIYGLYQPL